MIRRRDFFLFSSAAEHEVNSFSIVIHSAIALAKLIVNKLCFIQIPLSRNNGNNVASPVTCLGGVAACRLCATFTYVGFIPCQMH